MEDIVITLTPREAHAVNTACRDAKAQYWLASDEDTQVFWDVCEKLAKAGFKPTESPQLFTSSQH